MTTEASAQSGSDSLVVDEQGPLDSERRASVPDDAPIAAPVAPAPVEPRNDAPASSRAVAVVRSRIISLDGPPSIRSALAAHVREVAAVPPREPTMPLPDVVVPEHRAPATEAPPSGDLAPNSDQPASDGDDDAATLALPPVAPRAALSSSPDLTVAESEEEEQLDGERSEDLPFVVEAPPISAPNPSGESEPAAKVAPDTAPVPAPAEDLDIPIEDEDGEEEVVERVSLLPVESVPPASRVSKPPPPSAKSGEHRLDLAPSPELPKLNVPEGPKLDELTAGPPPPPPPVPAAKADGPKPPPPPPPKRKPAPPTGRKELPSVNDEVRSQRRPWWEEVFQEDFARVAPRLSRTQLQREVKFIEESLGVAPGGTVLDLACGTGEHAVELSARGYTVVGYDLSLYQLAIAADVAQERGQRLNFLQGDMREMAFEEMFDGLYCWNSSFGYFEEEKNFAVAQRMFRALRPGGALLLDLTNRDFVAQQEPMQVWFEGDACVCMDDGNLDFITSRLRVKRSVILDDGRSREVQFSMRLYSLHEIGKLLHDVGFRIVEVSGDHRLPGVFFGSASPRMVILAQRP